MLDDRDERPGVKFKDADLIGFPLRLTVGPRGLAAGRIEVRVRATGEDLAWPVEEAVSSCRAWLDGERTRLNDELERVVKDED